MRYCTAPRGTLSYNHCERSEAISTAQHLIASPHHLQSFYSRKNKPGSPVLNALHRESLTTGRKGPKMYTPNERGR